jgi:hypothetical protein
VRSCITENFLCFRHDRSRHNKTCGTSDNSGWRIGWHLDNDPARWSRENVRRQHPVCAQQNISDILWQSDITYIA